ncbi:type I restriction enzyme S subunit [Streptomyces sp. B3I7]|nr:type I restriction enzyme S subunit [Streptomyces sp. B3I7]
MNTVTGLGEIPAHWTVDRAKWLLERQRRAVRPDDGIVTAFRDGEVTLRHKRRTEGFTNAIQEMGYQGIRAGDLVVHGMDGFAGAIGVSDSDGKASPVVHAYVPNDNVDARYMAYVLRAMALSGYITTLAKGIRERSTSFDAPTLANVQLPIPPLTEQTRIADFLDRETAHLDALTQARMSQLRCLEEFWQSSLAGKAAALISSHGVLPLRRVVTSIQQGWSPQCDDAEAAPTEWAVLKTSAVSTGIFRPLEHKRLPEGIQPEPRLRILDGDILMTRGSGSSDLVGVAALASTEGRQLLLSDLLYRVRLRDDWSPAFVTSMLGSAPVRGLISLLLRGQSGQTIKLRAEDVKSIGVPATPTDLQPRIADELTDIRDNIYTTRHAVNHSLILLAERRRALIAAAVTGRFDVSTAGGRNVTEGVGA